MGKRAVDWTFEGYWACVLGANRSDYGVVKEFELDVTDRQGLSEWLSGAEAEAARVGGIQIPSLWHRYHERALDILCSALGPKYRIVSLEGEDLPITVDVEDYDTEAAASAMAGAWLKGSYRIEEYRP